MTPKQAIAKAAVKKDWVITPDDVLNALAAAGYAVVPVEPTEAMIQVGADKMDPTWGYSSKNVALDWAKEAWKDMIAEAQDNLIRETVKTPDGPQVMVSDGKPKQDKEPA